MTTNQNSLIPIAILSILIFGEKDQELLETFQELGVLRSTDNAISPPNTKQHTKNRHLTRAISITAHGKVEVERQFTNGLEKFRVTTTSNEPLHLEALDKETFVLREKDIRLNFQLRNVQLFDMNNYVIKGTKSLSKDDWAKISFELPPEVKLTCRYHMEGVVMGKQIRESGTCELKLTGVEVFGKVKVQVTEEAINIVELHLSYSFSDILIGKIGHLIIAGLNKNDISKLFNVTSKKYLREQMPTISHRLSEDIKKKLNHRLRNLSSTTIIKSVKEKHDLDLSEDEVEVKPEK